MRFSLALFLLVLVYSANQLRADDFGKIEKLSLVDKTPTVEFEYFISNDFKGIGKIVASWVQADFLTNDDTVYLKLDRPASPGDRFGIYRKMDKVDDPSSSFSGGHRIHYIGNVRILEVKEKVIVGKIYNAKENISRGDIVGEMMDASLKIQPQEPSQMVRGRVMSPAAPIHMSGTYEFAFINKGSKDGLKANDLLYVYRKGTGRKGISESDLPEVNVASLVVVNTSENFSTVYSLTGIEPFEKGAQFKSAINEVRYLDQQQPTANSESTAPTN